MKNVKNHKLVIGLLTVLALSFGYTQSVAAHGSGGSHSSHHDIHHGVNVLTEETGTKIPTGKGLPAGVTKVFEGKRYQWNGSFWKQMSQATW